MNELEQQLVTLGRELEFPAEPELAPVVLERLHGRRPFPFRALAIAVAVLAIALGAAFAVPQARTALLRFFHLRGASVERVETLPPALGRAQAGGLGRPLSRAAAERLIGFRLALPPLRGGDPGAVYVLDDALATVALRASGRPILLSEYRSGDPAFLEKSAVGATTIEPARVGSEPGFWIEGPPHTVTYLDRSGRFAQRTVLIRGNVLLWVRGALTLRLEGRLTKEQALRVARATR